MHSKCAPLQSPPLPLQGAVLCGYACTGAWAWFRGSLLGLLRLVGIGLYHSARKQTHLVGHRAGMGQILVKRYEYLGYLRQRQLLAHRVDSPRCESSDAIGAKRTCRERRERVDLTKMTPSRH